MNPGVDDVNHLAVDHEKIRSTDRIFHFGKTVHQLIEADGEQSAAPRIFAVDPMRNDDFVSFFPETIHVHDRLIRLLFVIDDRHGAGAAGDGEPGEDRIVARIIPAQLVSADIRELLFQLQRHPVGVVFRSIVHHDEFKRNFLPCKKLFQRQIRFPNPLFAVIREQYHGKRSVFFISCCIQHHRAFHLSGFCSRTAILLIITCFAFPYPGSSRTGKRNILPGTRKTNRFSP